MRKKAFKGRKQGEAKHLREFIRPKTELHEITADQRN